MSRTPTPSSEDARSARPGSESVRLIVWFLSAAVLVATLVVLSGTVAATDGEPTTVETPNATIVELYPSPVADGNVGEYLIIDLPVAGNWTLSDGHHRTGIPDGASGRIVVSMYPEAAAEHVETEVLPLPEYFPLSASGDRIVLAYDGVPVDVVAYDRARQAEVWNHEWDGPRGDGWRPYGYEPRSTSVHPGPVRADVFTLPDAPSAPQTAIADADDRVYLAAYTLESDRIADLLIDAARRGVTVRVVVEGTPVGGFSDRTANTLDRLAAAGIEPRVLAGPKTRFDFHHPKYAVADDRAVILTENWKPSGTGGKANRGWGVTVHDAAVAAELADVFETDVEAVDSVPWSHFQEDTNVHETTRASATYPERYEPRRVSARNVELLVAPENAADRIVDRIDRAEDRLLVVVPRSAGPEWRLLDAAIRAAERGVETRILLSNAWYDRQSNAALADELNRHAADGDVPLSVAVADPRGRYEKIHAKGIVVDETVIVGSLNWNEAAATRNREILVAFDSPAAARYFRTVYAADWRGGGARLPVGFLSAGLVSAAIAAAAARRTVAFV